MIIHTVFSFCFVALSDQYTWESLHWFWCDYAMNIHNRVKYEYHDFVKWKRLPQNWPFINGIHHLQRPVVRGFFYLFLDVSFEKVLRKHSSSRWWYPLMLMWCHSNDVIHKKCTFTIPWPQRWGSLEKRILKFQNYGRYIGSKSLHATMPTRLWL